MTIPEAAMTDLHWFICNGLLAMSPQCVSYYVKYHVILADISKDYKFKFNLIQVNFKLKLNLTCLV